MAENKRITRLVALLLALCCLLPAAALADEETEQLFAQRLAELKTPAQLGAESGEYQLRTGNSAYFPHVSPGVIPFDQMAETPLPAPEGTFSSLATC